MIVNETLPVIADPVLGGGVQSVVVSTVLIVMCETRLMSSEHTLTVTSCSFSEIIPQSLCTRYGLAIGAQMAWLVKILIYTVVCPFELRIAPISLKSNLNRALSPGLWRSSWNLY